MLSSVFQVLKMDMLGLLNDIFFNSSTTASFVSAIAVSSMVEADQQNYQLLRHTEFQIESQIESQIPSQIQLLPIQSSRKMHY